MPMGQHTVCSELLIFTGFIEGLRGVWFFNDHRQAGSVVENDMHLESTVIVDEDQLLELVHKDSSPSGVDLFCQCFLTDSLE